MTFCEQLNKYIKQIGCSSKELVNASGLSTSVISRYRRGDRKPSIRSKQLEQLVDGLYKLSVTKKMNITREEIYTALSDTLNDISIDFEQLSRNFNELITTLNINMSELSRLTSYDASLLSKIRTGNRNPTHPKDFATDVCNFIVTKYKSEDDKKSISLLIGCSLKDLNNNSNYFNKLSNWLSTNSVTSNNKIDRFLNNLDNFDLDKYIKAIHFDEMKVPFVPFYKSGSKTYYGIGEMKQGELDFFKATVLSKSNEPVFMCSDMPMSDMAEDTDFGKKWMFAIAMSLKKGLHLNIIHNIDRPFEEMMLGLESWIPIYMTGQISPFHLPDISTNIYHHLNYVSGSVALTGECINGHHENSKYYLTNNKEEVAYYKRKSLDILEKAKPLMEIFTEETNQKFNDFLNNTVMESGPRHNILSAPPLYTLTNELLEEILSHSDIDSDTRQQIADYIDINKENTYKVLEKNTVLDEIIDLSEEEFNSYPVALPLAGLFIDKRITYTYKEYKKHIELCREFSRTNANYSLKLNTDLAFRNIQICIIEGKFVLISKSKTPVIHFVIRHPKMVTAIEKFVPLVIE